MVDKKEERVSTMSDRIIDFDFSKLESPFGKGGNAAKNMLEMMQSQLAFKQMRLMEQDLNSEESKRKLEEARLAQLYSQGLIPQQVSSGQPQTSPADAIAKLFTNEQFTANFTQLTKETQERVIQSVIQAQASQGAGAG